MGQLQTPAISATPPVVRPAKGRNRLLPRAVPPLAIAAVILLAPAPHGLSPHAWHYFAIFTGAMVGIITEPLPPALVGLLGVVLAATTGVVYSSAGQAATWALGGFANGTVWLIFAAYTFALGYSKTGLGKRISLLLIRAMGKRTLGLGYAIALADLVLAPFMPSNTARSGGVIFPVLRSIPGLYGSHPGDGSERKIGAYLMFTALAATCVTSSMFLTGMAPNLLVAGIVSRTLHLTVSWTAWFKGFAPVGLVLFAALPLLLYKIYPPGITQTPDAPVWAAEKLRIMGPITRKETTLLALVIASLALWTAGARYIDATMAAILVVAAMVLLQVVSWSDILGNADAWNVLVWFATLITLAGGLDETGFVPWVARSFAPLLSGRGLFATAVLLAGAFFFLHYLFGSLTAHASALFAVFLGIALKLPGLSPMTWVLVLAYPLGLMGILTPYGTGPSPIYYGCGYIKGRDFWRLGLILGLLFFVLYAVLGVPWLFLLKN